MANINTTTHTAGRILTESEIRAYLKCSEFYKFGGQYKPPIKTQIIQRTIERVISEGLRKERTDPTFILTKTVLEGIRKANLHEELLEPQIDALQRRCIVLASEVFNILNLNKYHAVSGPMPFRVRVGRTAIELQTSATLRTTENQTLHVISFTPYSNAHAMRWDITTHMKLKALQRLVKPHKGRKADVRMHLFGVTENLVYTFLDDKDMNQDLISKGRAIINQMEAGYHMPLIPCPYGCPFKQQCQPEQQ